MPDFLDLTESQLISFAQSFAVKLAVHDGAPMARPSPLIGNLEVGRLEYYPLKYTV